MLKTTIKLLAFFLALVTGLLAQFVWAYESWESCGFASTNVDIVHQSAPDVMPEPANSPKLAPCDYPNSLKQYKYSRKNNVINGGRLNAKLVCGVLPEYPANALAENFSGTVVLEVLVDETGEIISAKGKDGNPLLQQAAIKAAYQSRTTPTLLGGESMKVRGNLIYIFDRENSLTSLNPAGRSYCPVKITTAKN